MMQDLRKTEGLKIMIKEDKEGARRRKGMKDE